MITPREMATGDASIPTIARASAAAIAILSWTTLLWGVGDHVARYNGSVLGGIWSIAQYLSIWVNLSVTLVFTGLVMNIKRLNRPSVMGAMLVLLIIMTALYWAFQTWSQFVASPLRWKLLHGLIPVVVPLHYALFGARAPLRLRHVFLWVLAPMAYTGYVLVRGVLTGVYPYYQLNMGQRGVAAVLIDVAIIAATSFLVGLVIVIANNNVLAPTHAGAAGGSKSARSAAS